MKSNKVKRLLSLLLVLIIAVSTTVVGISSYSAAESGEGRVGEASDAEPSANEYQIVSPVPSGSSITPIEQPPRLDSLYNKRIALVGGSFSASVTHAVIRDLLEERYNCTTFYMTEEIGKSGTFNPNSISEKSRQFQQKLIEYNIDGVISGNCGCGICTVKETGNGLAAEYAGVPAVVVGAEAFVPQIESTGYNRGVPVVRTAAYPGAFASDTTAEQERKAREVLFPQIENAFVDEITDTERERIASAIAGVNHDDIVFTGSFERVQQFYETSEMSDGLTVVPPTRAKIEYYLQYCTYNATDIVNSRNGEVVDVPPANRRILAYHVAANAVMAGCPPEFMPICIGIVRLFANGNFYKSLASTHGWTPYVLVNGPIARQLGLSSQDGMINEEANKLLGRFISLAMLNLAGYKIKENRMGTFGYLQPFAFAEDEQACIQIGWNPYHVEKGYDLNTNVVTCGSTLTWGNPIEIGTTDPEKALQLLSWDVTEKQQNGLGNTNPREARMVWLTKQAAATIAQADGCGSKTGLKNTLVNTARRPLWMRTYAHYWANTGSKIHMNTTFDEHYNAIKSGASTENVERDIVSTTDVPEWLRGVVPYSQIDTTQTIEESNTNFVITGGDAARQIQIMPGGDCASINITLPTKYNTDAGISWDELVAREGYRPIGEFVITQ